MRNKRSFIGAVLCVLLSLPVATLAQSSSINTFSPYSFYGIGDFSALGTVNVRSMGGAGVAYRDGTSINFLNPASLSMIPRKSALFNFGLEGKNYYLKTSDKKSSYNSFNVSNVAFAIPLAKKVGMGVAIMPFSSVGYRIEDVETQLPIGQMNYLYTGEGDVTQARLSLGFEPIKNLSLGAEMMYYFGSIQRASAASLTPLDGSMEYKSAYLTINEDISRLFANFGAQYTYELPGGKRALVAGATFQPKGKLKPKISKFVPNSDNSGDFGDYLLSTEYTNEDLTLPAIVSGGLYFHTLKMSVGADYVFQNWSGSNLASENANVKFRNTNTIKAGAQYTPDRGNVRSIFNRITYRLGARYSDYYMQLNGKNLSEKALTLGASIPVGRNGFGVPAGLSSIDLGLEFGQRGKTNNGLIKENFWGFSIGFSLFGDDFWFHKPQYD